MTNEEPLPKKVRLSETDFKVMEAYVQALKGKYIHLNSNDVTGLRESEEKLKQQQQESACRENILVKRLTTTEQEMQECATQIQYLKQVQQPSVAQLRSTVDPTINFAWRFMPDSQTGKKLMAKCQMLIQENQELGRQLSQGWLKSSQDELNDFIIQLEEEVEGMQSTILEPRQQLAQYQQQQSQAPGPSTSRTTSSAPVGQAEATCKDCSHLASGPSNGSSSWQRTSGSGFHREGYTAEDDFPSSSGNGNKASSRYESIDSLMGSENFLTHHSNDTDSKHDPQEEKIVSGKGNRTVASRHVQNGLDSSVNVQSSVL
ncbi:hypothetical protein K5549_006663 [Capra hircus]|nr:hypothetical protein K5549_006663 [Capra hircus]